MLEPNMITKRQNVVKDSIEGIRDILRFIIIGLFTLTISACVALGPQQEPQPVEPEPVEEVAPFPPPPPDSLNPSKRVRKALQLLEQGDYTNARLQLAWALQEKPTLQIASNLLEQMEVDPIDYLGMKSFFYNVEPGDSLSIIAKKFLNDPLKFVILARYNKLENPSKLAPGQRIRVPGVMPERKRKKPKPKPTTITKETPEPTPISTTQVEQAMDTPESETANNLIEELPLSTPEETEQLPIESKNITQPPADVTVDNQPLAKTADEVIISARGLHGEGNLSAAIYLLEDEIGQHPDAKALQKLLAGYYNEQADLQINRADLEKARGTLEKLIILDSSNDAAINKLIQVEDKIEAKKLLHAAHDQEMANDLEAAHETYTQVLTYDPEDPQAKESQLRVRGKLTDNYHRRAMQLFRKQDLDEAIAFWNKILKLNPNHPLAAGYKARALEMKQQLQKFGQ
jgi:tetratricopeptide (TPR) repeat protein